MISFKPGDNLPSLICQNCVTRLKVAYDFIQLAHSSEKNLREFVTRISSDFQKVTKVNCGIKSSSYQEDEEEDNAITLLESSLQYNSDKGTQREECFREEKEEKEDRSNNKVQSRHLGRKCSTTSTFTINNSCNTNYKLLEVEKEKNNFKQEVVEYLTDEEIVYYDESSPFEENENEKSIYAGSSDLKKESEKHIENNTLIEFSEDETKSISDSKPMSEYLEEYNIIPIEQDGNDCPGSLSPQLIYENTSDDGEEDKEAPIEIEMNEKPATNQESLHLYEDTEEIFTDSRDGNLSSNENSEDTNAKDYIRLDLRTTESAEIASETEDFRPIEIMSIANVMETTEKTKARNSSPPKQKNRITELKSLKQTPAMGSTQTKSKRVSKSTTTVDDLSINARYFCMKCNRDFSTKTNLTRHMSTHEGIKPYKCTECQKCFSQNGSLKQHMYTHTGERPYVCEICDHGFTQYKSLVFHMRRHTGEKPFPCDQCGLLFRQKDGLKTHILKHHMIRETNGDTETHTCIICKKLLATKYALQVHMKKHLNPQRRALNSQSNTITTTTTNNTDLLSDDDLMADGAFVTDDLALSIEDVTSSTQVLDTMTANTAKTNRAKKFQCRKCYKCFAIKKNLLRHLTTHDVSPSDLFQCPSCQVTFFTNYALRVHRVREHKETGINLNECELCNITFAGTTELLDHNKSVHDATDRYRSDCPDLQFTTQKQLFEHLIEHDNFIVETDAT